MITVNKSKAIEIVIDRLRAEREPRLKDLDLAVMLADESNAPKADLIAQKQALRDVTDKPFSYLSIDELAAVTLDKALAME